MRALSNSVPMYEVELFLFLRTVLVREIVPLLLGVMRVIVFLCISRGTNYLYPRGL